MTQPPDEDPDSQDRNNIAVLVAVILLVGLTVFLLIRLRHGIQELDCSTQGRRNCAPVEIQ